MAYLATQRRPGTSAPGDGSRTVTITDASPREDDGTPSNNPDGPAPVGALRLRGGPRRTRQRVVWDDDVVDNEGCGRKSSKICCIYHKPKNFDESSDSDSSDSDSSDDGRARARQGHGPNHNHHPHPHPHPDAGGSGAAAAQRDPQMSAVAELEEASQPNAYEIVPSGKKGKGKRRSG
ncbi:phosphatase inhibitor-domain-containing protein [Mycena alexandri]|uniref:Type 1 phosphatases regulator n=1 Tax=Mycena alexandri TaxID=1745969 RepID=A0AAD6TAG7_9AGAR|nr:phosphatase inhibitor-domain-containing protein [Mycena alexandri]